LEQGELSSEEQILGDQGNTSGEQQQEESKHLASGAGLPHACYWQIAHPNHGSGATAWDKYHGALSVANDMPCSRFGANAAWLRLAVLTHNVITALKRMAVVHNNSNPRRSLLSRAIFIVESNLRDQISLQRSTTT
jgi:hypothetical protein